MALIDPATAAALVKRYESHGDYNAKNPTSTASGAYQFIDGTWRGYARQVGIDTGIYPTARSAPPELQDKVFQHAVQTRGLADWTCPGCNPALVAHLNQNGMGMPMDGQPQAQPAMDPKSMADLFSNRLKELQDQQARLSQMSAAGVARPSPLAFGVQDPLVSGLNQVATAFKGIG